MISCKIKPAKQITDRTRFSQLKVVLKSPASQLPTAKWRILLAKPRHSTVTPVGRTLPDEPATTADVLASQRRIRRARTHIQGTGLEEHNDCIVVTIEVPKDTVTCVEIVWTVTGTGRSLALPPAPR